MTWHLQNEGHGVNQKRILRLMRLMPIDQKPDSEKRVLAMPDRARRPIYRRDGLAVPHRLTTLDVLRSKGSRGVHAPRNLL